MIVVDASVLVAASMLADDAADWARQVIVGDDLAAPHLAPVEAQQAIRRLLQRDAIDVRIANQARLDVLAVNLDLHPFAPFADRVWSLRENLTAYDAWYVAVAEALDCPLATLDRRLADAPGLSCDVRTP
ncbi:MAG: type II toxin-antitoxin system VapC family toxin [Actinomycetota bacterium]|nr:type II toxin-antitoxin system VapC family toxin [Actinomycetota bacterium]